MRHFRKIIGIGVLVFSIWLILFGEEVYRPLLYHLRAIWYQEVYFEGMPTSYWVDQIHAKRAGSYEETKTKLVEGGADAVPILVQALERRPDDVSMRRTAVHCLLLIGPAARDAVPALIRVRDDEDPVVREWAREALRNIGSSPER